MGTLKTTTTNIIKETNKVFQLYLIKADLFSKKKHLKILSRLFFIQSLKVLEDLKYLITLKSTTPYIIMDTIKVFQLQGGPKKSL